MHREQAIIYRLDAPHAVFPVKLTPILDRVLGDTGIRRACKLCEMGAVYPPRTKAEQKPLKEQSDNGVKMPVTTIILTSTAMYFGQN